MKLDLSSFEKALLSLEKAIKRSLSALDDEELRDSVIQRFEYSYELAWKMLKRQLESDSPNPSEIDLLNFKDLIREAATKGYISKPERWFEYREHRNLTAQTYDQNKAQLVHSSAQFFMKDAQELLKILKIKNP